jgi:hypothetical protein
VKNTNGKYCVNYGAVAELFELREGRVAINCLRSGKRFDINDPSKIDFI